MSKNNQPCFNFIRTKEKKNLGGNQAVNAGIRRSYAGQRLATPIWAYSPRSTSEQRLNSRIFEKGINHIGRADSYSSMFLFMYQILTYDMLVNISHVSSPASSLSMRGESFPVFKLVLNSSKSFTLGYFNVVSDYLKLFRTVISRI